MSFSSLFWYIHLREYNANSSEPNATAKLLFICSLVCYSFVTDADYM